MQLFSHKDSKTRRGDEYKLNNGIFSLMSLRKCRRGGNNYDQKETVL